MIEITNLVKRYGDLCAVDDLSLSIGPGEIFGFIGPNGAGKSTTMKVLSGLILQDSGVATVDGMDTRKHAAHIRRILGYMPDSLGVYDDLTVDEYLQFFAAAFRIERSRRKSTIEGVLELTDLTEKRNAMVDSLSRGMKQRLGVARVLIHDPKVLLLDEPASGLDPRARIEMRSLLAELGRMGKVLMVSSHILSELAEMCTSIGIIERGKLLFSGSIAEAYDRVSVGDRVQVVLAEGGASAEAVAAQLNEEQRVVKCAADGLKITVELSDRGGHHFLIERVIGAGGRIDSVRPMEVRLEDAFLELTRGKVQ